MEEDEELVQYFILPGYNDGVCEGEDNGESEEDLMGGFGALPVLPGQVENSGGGGDAIM